MRIRAKRVVCAVAAPFVVLLWGGCPMDPLPEEKNADSTNSLRIDAITPSNGPAAGGTRVTITGGPFEDKIGVLFGGHAAVDPIMVNTRMITAIAPPQAPRTVDITVLSNGGQTTVLGAFTYESSGVWVDSVEPAFGPLQGGTLVTLRGSGMPADVGVLFGETASTEVTYINEQLVTAVTPAHGEAIVDVTLVYPDGQFVVPETYTFTTFTDDGTDTDGDGLTDFQEMIGWEIWIDSFAQSSAGSDSYFNIYKYAVTSDPNNPDTDGDGLNDEVEFLIKSDPRKYDSDDDGLRDAEEWNQWLTSPTSVDTDGDARGGSDPGDQLAPNQALFDGLELFDQTVLRLKPGHPDRVVKPRATSPTLADTDGDGVSDADEFDSTVRNSVVADLPRLEYELVGDVDVRLMIEYAESEAESEERGVTLTQSDTDTVASSLSNTIGWSLEIATTIGIEAGTAHTTSNISTTVTGGIHGETTWTTSKESSHTASEETSEVIIKSKEFTETAAEGSIRTAILLKNAGNTTFTLNGLSVLVSQREKLKKPGDRSPAKPIKTIATMSPVFDAVALAPGETAGPFELAATGVNADAIKELLAHPDTLMLGTAGLNFTDSAGLDFDFVRQFTVAQTAYIVIDFGDGEVRHHNVATNVDRNPDSTYRGITLRQVLEEVLGLPFGDDTNGYTTMVDPDPKSDLQVLESLLDRRYTRRDGVARNVWNMITNNGAHTTVDFNDAVLRAGDYVHLMFSRDDDNDGLSNSLEKAAGTDQDPSSDADADRDGLTDRFEVIDGWIAFEDPADPDRRHPQGIEKFRVFSSATSADTDGDGLTDFEEWQARSDPNDPDTDGDSLLDGHDPFPIYRAATLFVDADAPEGGNGRKWATAYRTIQEALVDAAAGQQTPNQPEDDVAQIWVAGGEYRPLARLSPILMLNNLNIYGGFSGAGANFAGETKRGQRNTNAFTNGCIITGDIDPDHPDTGAIDLDDPGTRDDNCPVVVAAGEDIDSSALLDGFMITGAYAQDGDADGGALSLLGSPTIQNCLFTRNANQRGGAGVRVAGDSSAVFRKCILAGNVASYGGGAYLTSTGQIVFEDCEFSQNVAVVRTDNDRGARGRLNGGGASIESPPGGRVDFNRCAFTGNQAWNWGGGLYALGDLAYVRVDSCRFYSNATTGTDDFDKRLTGGGMHLDADASVSNSVFWDNRAAIDGGGIFVGNANGSNPRRVTITNCTLAYNRSLDFSGLGNWAGGGILARGPGVNVSVQNTIAWQNYFELGAIPDPGDGGPVEASQIWADNATVTVRNCCLNGGFPGRYRGNGNINDDPSLSGLELGDLRLGGESPCIDRGNTFVDLDPLLPGFQQLPEFDFFGNPRIADGNGDGIVAVDIGAFEVRTPE